ncbi:MAG: hypothetical protein AAFX08_08445 [Pseudomonadota bacterium]
MLIAALLTALLSPEAPPQPDFLTRAAAARYETSADQYADCVALIAENPELGEASARAWMIDGGGAPALHCAAVAHLALDRPRLAAVRLLELSERSDVGDDDARATVLGEAALAWVEAEEPGFAEEAAEAALASAPWRADLAIVAAKAHASAGSWQAAADAVTAAEDGDAKTAEAYIIRARAKRALGKDEEAAEDVVRALQLNPFDLDALVLRGELIQAGVIINANYRKPTRAEAATAVPEETNDSADDKPELRE